MEVHDKGKGGNNHVISRKNNIVDCNDGHFNNW